MFALLTKDNGCAYMLLELDEELHASSVHDF